MTGEQIEKIYKHDKNEYILKSNEDYLKWCESKKEYYGGILEVIDKHQKFIDKVVSWYEFKFTNKFFDLKDGTYDIRFEDLTDYSGNFVLDQLLFAMEDEELDILNPGYYSGLYVGQSIPDFENERINYHFKLGIEFAKMNNEGKDYFNVDSKMFLFADHETGIVELKHEFSELIGAKEIDIHTLYNILSVKHDGEYDLSNLERCLMRRQVDLENRKWLLNMVSLKLFFSHSTSYDRGYARAEIFVKEFNEKFGLDLNLDHLDVIVRSAFGELKLIRYNNK